MDKSVLRPRRRQTWGGPLETISSDAGDGEERVSVTEKASSALLSMVPPIGAEMEGESRQQGSEHGRVDRVRLDSMDTLASVASEMMDPMPESEKSGLSGATGDSPRDHEELIASQVLSDRFFSRPASFAAAGRLLRPRSMSMPDDMKRLHVSRVCGGLLDPELAAIYNQDGRIGIYTKQERRRLLEKYHAKRHRRVWRKKIRYQCRKSLADRRIRIKGRFVKAEDMPAAVGTGGAGSGGGKGKRGRSQSMGTPPSASPSSRKRGRRSPLSSTAADSSASSSPSSVASGTRRGRRRSNTVSDGDSWRPTSARGTGSMEPPAKRPRRR